MKTLRFKIPSLLAACLVGLAVTATAQSTTTWPDLKFDQAGQSFAGWGSPALTGIPGAGVTTVVSTLPEDPEFNSGLFPTPPTSGYLALTSDASAVTSTPKVIVVEDVPAYRLFLRLLINN